MPFDGGGRTGNESPADHHTFWGGFAWDFHKSPGAVVKANFVSSDGAISLVVGSITDSNGVGLRVPVTAKVKGIAVGSVRFEHLVKVKVSSGQRISSGGLIGHLASGTYPAPKCPDGTADGFPYQPGRWEVCTPSGIHTHVEFKQGCWRSGLGTNASVDGSTGIAMLSTAYTTANSSACDTTELDAVNRVSAPRTSVKPLTISERSIAWGDFDGDSYADLAIGLPGEDVGRIADAGAVNVIYGGASGLDTSRGLGLTQHTASGAGELSGSAEAGDYLGAALTAGDFDGDSYADLAIGLPGEDVGRIADAGAVNVIYGGASGLDTSRGLGLTQHTASGAGELSGSAEAGDYLGGGNPAARFR
jgi:hypothetical protein